MKVSDLKPEEVKVGLRVKSLSKPRSGTVVSINPKDDDFASVIWDGDLIACSGFYENDCKCEVVLDENGKPVYVEVDEDD